MLARGRAAEDEATHLLADGKELVDAEPAAIPLPEPVPPAVEPEVLARADRAHVVAELRVRDVRRAAVGARARAVDRHREDDLRRRVVVGQEDVLVLVVQGERDPFGTPEEFPDDDYVPRVVTTELQNLFDRLPAIPSYELSGVVEEVGPGVAAVGRCRFG